MDVFGFIKIILSSLKIIILQRRSLLHLLMQVLRKDHANGVLSIWLNLYIYHLSYLPYIALNSKTHSYFYILTDLILPSFANFSTILLVVLGQ